MKNQPSTFCVTLALMTVATLLIAARSQPVNTNADLNDVAANPAPPLVATEPAAEPSPKSNGMKKAAHSARLSFGVGEVVKMYQSGVEADVIMNYIESSSVPYHLNAEEVVHLHSMGVPSQIITSMMRHGAQVQQQANAASAVIQQKATEEAKAASASFNPYSYYVPPAAAVSYTYAYPTYVNTYPAYVYPRYYPSYYSYPRYCYSSPYYYGYGYSGYRHCYPYRGYGHFYGGYRHSYVGYGHYPRFSVGASFGHSPRIGIRARF